MEMEEYLAIMLEWQEERFQQYCMYCEECMFDVYEVWLQNDGQFNDDDNRNLTEFNEFKEHQRNLGNYDDEYQGGQAIKNYYQVCPEFNTCTEYSTTCQRVSSGLPL